MIFGVLAIGWTQKILAEHLQIFDHGGMVGWKKQLHCLDCRITVAVRVIWLEKSLLEIL